MELRKLCAMVCMVLLIMVSFTSCMSAEKTLPAPHEAAVEEPPAETLRIDWNLTAQGLEVSIGERITLVLPPDGSASTIWGDGIYTDDSSIGTAAVHMGIISFASGGEVTIGIKDGLSSYEGSTRNGVTSTPYDEWGASFVFIDRNGKEILVP